MCVHVCVYTHVQRPEVEVRCLPRCSPFCFLRQGLSLNLALVDSSNLSGSPFALPQCWHHRQALLCLLWGGVLQIHTQVLMHVRQTPYCLSMPPDPELLLVLENMYLYSSL